ncbi:hypothetical protein F6R98_06560 [Candidatus Methylospira mobilis]|uniref:Uncharacterized protein n=1 Tax=Candidatus Methylospira mobilis TaxID=1808979 RepID=A0A5Q0BET1_9GAMM|nr:hypothetical protein [Candidatus Methylospira mobilis]QFY42330.1 hypothetical protein F6R98_06560 [Candidatus Methylospira mobilis]
MDIDINKKLAGEIFSKTGIAIDPDDPAFVIVHLNRMIFDGQKIDLAGMLDRFAANVEKQADKIHISIDQLSEVYNDLERVHKEIFYKSEEFQKKSADAAANSATEQIKMAEEIASRNVELAEKVAVARAELAGEEAKARADVWADDQKVNVKQVITEVVRDSLQRELAILKESTNDAAKQIEAAKESLNNNNKQVLLLILACLSSSFIAAAFMVFLINNNVISIQKTFEVNYESLASRIIEAIPPQKKK